MNLLINSYLRICEVFSNLTQQWAHQMGKSTMLVLRALIIDFLSPLLGICPEYFFLQLFKASISPLTTALKELCTVLVACYYTLWSKLIFTTSTKVRYVRNARRTFRIGIYTTFDMSTGIVLTYSLKYKTSHSDKAKFYHHGLRKFSTHVSQSMLNTAAQATDPLCHTLSRIVGGGRLQTDAIMRARKVRTAQWRHRNRRQKVQAEQIVVKN